MTSRRFSLRSLSTSCLTLSPCALLSTSTASWVVTTTTSSTPTTAVKCSSERTCTFEACMTTPAADRVNEFIALRELPHRPPIADIRPANACRHDGGLSGLLHHGIINGLFWRVGKGLRIEDQKLEILLRLGKRFGCGLRHLRLELAQLLLHNVGAEEEIAGVPKIPAGEIFLRRSGIGLFHKSLGLQHRPVRRHRLPRLDVAVARCGLAGLNAERDNIALHGGPRGSLAQLDEFFPILHHMIGRKNGCHRIGAEPGGKTGSNGHRRAGVAAHRLKDDARLAADLLELLGDQKAVLLVGNHNRRLKGAIADDFGGHLKGRERPQEGNKLLWQALARFWPNAGPSAAAHNHWKNSHAPKLLAIDRNIQSGPIDILKSAIIASRQENVPLYSCRI